MTTTSNLFPKRPNLPRRLHHFGDLVDRSRPDKLNEAEDRGNALLGLILESGVRAGDVIDRVRALVKKAPVRKDSLEINEVVLEVIALTRREMARMAFQCRRSLWRACRRFGGIESNCNK
jgi:hypothetical protein